MCVSLYKSELAATNFTVRTILSIMASLETADTAFAVALTAACFAVVGPLLFFAVETPVIRACESTAATDATREARALLLADLPPDAAAALEAHLAATQPLPPAEGSSATAVHGAVHGAVLVACVVCALSWAGFALSHRLRGVANTRESVWTTGVVVFVLVAVRVLHLLCVQVNYRLVRRDQIQRSVWGAIQQAAVTPEPEEAPPG